MARETYDQNEDQNTEYQFNDDTDNLSYDYEEQQPPKKSGRRLKRRPIIMLIVALIVIYVVYKLIVIFFGTSVSTPTMKRREPVRTITTSTRPAVSQQQTSAARAALLAQQQEAQKQAQQQTKTAASSKKQADMNDKINNLQQSNQALVHHIEKQQFQTQTSMMGLKDSIDNINSKLSAISNSVQDLSTVAEEDENRASELAQAKRDAKRREMRYIRSKRRYIVDAVIPGRAWLKGADGTVVTVAVGDRLRGYGKVSKINPFSGQVVTKYGTIPYATR